MNMRAFQMLCAIGLLALPSCSRAEQKQHDPANPQSQAEQAETDKLRAELREAEKDPEFNKRTEKARESAARNLQAIGKALAEYEKTHPAQYDEHGRPLKKQNGN
jgi:hypothetical protein